MANCLSAAMSHACPCCSGVLHGIGKDVSERLDIVRAQLRVLVIRRPKSADRLPLHRFAQIYARQGANFGCE